MNQTINIMKKLMLLFNVYQMLELTAEIYSEGENCESSMVNATEGS